jgi:hypothetical protein
MRYDFEIETAASTGQVEPTRVVTPLNKGRLIYGSVFFPWGCAGLVHIRILHYEHQLYPTNLDAWFSGNDILIEFECAYDIEEGWKEFKVEAYNEDDFYQHAPVVSFVVLPISGLYQPPVAWVEG